MPQMSPALGAAVKTGARADHRPALARRKASRIAQVSYRHSPLPHSNSGTAASGESGCLAVRSHMTYISWTTCGPSEKGAASTGPSWSDDQCATATQPNEWATSTAGVDDDATALLIVATHSARVPPAGSA